MGFAASTEDRAALALLLGLATITPRRLLELAARHPTASACLRAVAAGESGSEADRAVARSASPAEVLERTAQAGARLVSVDDREYPAPLLDLFDPPAALFVRGRSLEGVVSRVAIVGARNCSAGGREVATALGAAVASAGGVVVSGGARGVDAAAHDGALQSGGATVAVLGCGVDVAYPRQNRPLLARIAANGAVVSEYPPGVRAEPFRFPARNRLVAALSQAVVVVEGAPGSGSLITAEHALDIGREVFGVPGPVWSELAAAPLQLIREGAGLIRGPEDLLEDLGLTAPAAAFPDSAAHGKPRPPPGAEGRPHAAAGAGASSDTAGSTTALTELERAVWGSIDAPLDAGTLAARVGLDLPDVLSALTGLELRGLVAQVGGRFERRGPFRVVDR